MKSFPCVARCRDGSPCGRRVTDGSNPPICHLHKQTIGKPFVSTKTPLQRVEKIAADDRHQHQMAAIKILLEREEGVTGDPAQKMAANVITAMTAEEKAEIRGLLLQVQLIKERVVQRHPDVVVFVRDSARADKLKFPTHVARAEGPYGLQIVDGAILDVTPLDVPPPVPPMASEENDEGPHLPGSP